MSETASDQKTEEPTARRLEKAMEDGQVAFSNELVGGLILLMGVFFFWFMGKWFFDQLLNTFRERVTLFEPMTSHPDSIMLAIQRGVTQAGLACLGLMIPLAIITVLAGVLQTQFNLSSKPLNLAWNKLDPTKGFKRVFSTRSVNKGAVAIAKTTVIIIAVFYLTKAKFGQIALSGTFTFAVAIEIGAEIILAVGFVTAVLMVLIGIADFGFQKWKHLQDLRMSIQEVRDEYKEVEGDPMVKARVRRLRNEMGRKRMLQDVPKATVVVTNPTHFAVALRYEPSTDEAPVVIAKGSDFVAKKIIELAKEHGVAVVERKPIARFLHANVNIGQAIPIELYQAVAEILNYVRKMGSQAA